MKGEISILLLSVVFALATDIDSQCPADYTKEVLLPHKECNKYYQCVHGKALELQCGENLFYNPITQQCDYEENVDCSGRGEDEPETPASEEVKQLPICECPSDFNKELLFPHEDCSKFYKCYEGKPAPLSCQPGLVYNAEKEWCDWPNNVDCSNREFTCPDPNELLVNEIEDKEVNAECPSDWSMEKLLPHNNCNKFYKCYQGSVIAHDCPFGLYYNIGSEQCDWPQNVECSGRVH